MDQKELERWIQEQRSDGFKDKQIKKLLIEEGVNESRVEKGFRNLEGNSPNELSEGQKRHKQNSKTQETKFTFSKVLDIATNFLRTRNALIASGIFILPMILTGLLDILDRLGFSNDIVIGLIALPLLILFPYSLIKTQRIIMAGVGLKIGESSVLGFFIIFFRYIVGWIAYLTAIFVGFIFLIIPGIYMSLALFFWDYEVLKGEGLIQAFKKSYRMTKGRRFKIGAYLILVSFLAPIISILVLLPFLLISFLGFQSVVTWIYATIQVVVYTAFLASMYSILMRKK